jgi:hypothetical protein
LICPFGNDVVVITSAGGEIVSARVTVCVRAGLLASVTLNVNSETVAATVGVPIIAPVDAFKLRPAGRVPDVSDQV